MSIKNNLNNDKKIEQIKNIYSNFLQELKRIEVDRDEKIKEILADDDKHKIADILASLKNEK
ncbi:MAG: hypothetical protein MUF50_00730 [Planctomycetes bacterium]|jgi:hypothetical protein|nr:hypothetical protein [Planctomycetota bacterium]